jgi:ABC-type dipeptide/oligopeptide/nickel transport system permease subunit
MSAHVGNLAEAPVGGLAPKPGAPRARALRLPRSAKVITGVVIVLVFAVLTVIGPWIAPYDPSSNAFGLTKPPSAAHWLGTTSLGQDVLSQLLNGARATMVVGFVAGLIATVLSVVIGVAAGYLGGPADEGLSLTANVFLAIPGLPLLIVIDSYLPAGSRSNTLLIGIIISLTGWAYGARVLRAQTLSVRKRDFVEAARIAGESRSRIIFFEVLPNLVAIVAASFLFTMLYAIGAFVALAYLGLTSTASWNWGTMLYWAQSNNAPLAHEWWWFVPPGMAIALVGTGLALLNFGIDEFINPRLRTAGLLRRASHKAGLPRHPKLGLTPVVRRPAHSTGARPGGNGSASVLRTGDVTRMTGRDGR